MMLFFKDVIIKRLRSLLKTFFNVFKESRCGVFSKKDVAENRMNACMKCDQFNPKNGMCDACGCIMFVKAKFKAAKCGLEDKGEESQWPI